MPGKLQLAALVTLLSVNSAFATDADKCTVFSVVSTGEFRQIQQIDVDESGDKTPGDKLTGFRVLLDEEGNKVGDRYFIGLFHEFGPDGKNLRRTTEVVNVLKTGAIFTTKEKIGGKDLPSRINGGTGEFAGATGTVMVSRKGTSNVYEFRVNCSQAKDS